MWFPLTRWGFLISGAQAITLCGPLHVYCRLTLLLFCFSLQLPPPPPPPLSFSTRARAHKQPLCVNFSPIAQLHFWGACTGPEPSPISKKLSLTLLYISISLFVLISRCFFLVILSYSSSSSFLFLVLAALSCKSLVASSPPSTGCSPWFVTRRIARHSRHSAGACVNNRARSESLLVPCKGAKRTRERIRRATGRIP